MVIPVHDLNPLRRTPWITYSLIAVNVVIFLLSPGTLPTAPQAATICPSRPSTTTTAPSRTS